MGLFEAIIAGLVGGAAEMLPVGAPAHQALAERVFFDSPYNRSFAGACEIAVALAALVALRTEVGELARSVANRGAEGRPMLFIVLAATVPAALIQVPFREAALGLLRDLAAVGVLLLVSGLLLYVAEEIGRRSRLLEQLGTPGALLIGLLQAPAVLPGVSRTGAAICGGMLVGITREAATRFAILLSIPLLLFFGAQDLLQGTVPPADAALGATAAFAGAFGAARFMLAFSRASSMMVFAYYLWAVGVAAIALDVLRQG